MLKSSDSRLVLPLKTKAGFLNSSGMTVVCSIDDFDKSLSQYITTDVLDMFSEQLYLSEIGSSFMSEAVV